MNMLLCPYIDLNLEVIYYAENCWPVLRRRARAEMAMTVMNSIATATSIIRPTMISVEFSSVDWFDPKAPNKIADSCVYDGEIKHVKL